MRRVYSLSLFVVAGAISAAVAIGSAGAITVERFLVPNSVVAPGADRIVFTGGGGGTVDAPDCGAGPWTVHNAVIIAPGGGANRNSVTLAGPAIEAGTRIRDFIQMGGCAAGGTVYTIYEGAPE